MASEGLCAVRSSKAFFVKTSGLRWISLMLLASIPWIGRVWALPFLTILAPSERYNAACRRRHKKLTDWARQAILQVRRWAPDRKIVVVDGKVMRPLLDQSQLDVAWHAGQYQALPEIYVQNSALEIAWTRVVSQTGTREGRVVAPFFTRDHEGFNVDDEEDWARARALVDSGEATLPRVDRQ